MAEQDWQGEPVRRPEAGLEVGAEAAPELEALEALRRAGAEFRSFDLDDRQALVRAGAALEEALTVVQSQVDAPPEVRALRDLLAVCLEGLQAVYLGTAPDPPAAVGAVAGAVTAMERFLQADEASRREADLEAGARALAATLQPAPAGDVPPAFKGPPDDAAAGEPVRAPVAADGERGVSQEAGAPPAGRLARAPGADGERAPSHDRRARAAGRVLELPPDGDPYLLGEFVTESREYIAGAEAALLALETNPDDAEAINTVFRAFHTIKGTAGFMGLAGVATFAHRAETFLSRMRDGEIRCTGGYADLALRAVDLLKELIDAVQEALDGDQPPWPAGYDDLLPVLADPEGAGIDGDPAKAAAATLRVGDILVGEGKVDRQQVEAAAAMKGSDPIGVALVRSNTASALDVARALRMQRRLAPGEQALDGGVRVRTDRLDRLIDLAGELVIAHSMVALDETVLADPNTPLARKIARTSKILRELQDLTLAMRMVPVKATFQKMRRLVRDLAQRTGKRVHLVTEGEETEVDRNMVDALNDPLVHLIRNAIDHGIEPPDVRERQGKPPTGTLHLVAFHTGDSIVVELHDDGRGLDRERIISKAAAKGLLDPARPADALSDREVFELIFSPGVSTAERITDLSGRGVGMDVVKRHVEALRGRIDISSAPGRGTTFTLRLPLTLAVTDGMIVKVGPERYIVPTGALITSFRPDAGALATVAGRGELVRLRSDLLPVVRLHRLFDIRGAVEDPARGLLLVTEDAGLAGGRGHRYALLVDELVGQQQVVAKPLGTYLHYVEGISGAAILGDGRVGLILEPAELAALARRAA